MAAGLAFLPLQPPTPSSGESQSEHQPSPTEHRENGGPDQRGTPEAPIFFQIQQSPDQKTVAANPKDEGNWYARPDWWVAGFTGALFFATTGLWIFTALLWIATRRAVSEGADAIKAAEATAKAGAEHASHAERAIKVSEESAERQLRAYVYPERIASHRIEIGVSPNISIRGWIFYVIWKNWGNTPTKDMIIYSARSIAPFPLPSIFDYTHTNESPPSATSLPPQGIMYGMHFAVPVEILEEVRIEARFLYLWGWTEYNDVFQSTPRHRSEYCIRIEVASDPRVGDCSFRFERVGPHNGTDNECRYKPTTTAEDATRLREI